MSSQDIVLIDRRVPRAFYRARILDGSRGTSPVWGQGCGPVAENGFRAFQMAKVSHQDRQLIIISCICIPKIKLSTVRPVLRGHSKENRLWLNAGQKYWRMLQRKHSAILSTFIKLQFVIDIRFYFRLSSDRVLL